MTHYHVGFNLPGYMPESTPYCTDDHVHAWMVFQDDVTRTIDSIELDDATYLDIDTARNVMAESDLAANGLAIDIDGIRHWAEPVAGSVATCELWDEV
jgi:heme oxygenase